MADATEQPGGRPPEVVGPADTAYRPAVTPAGNATGRELAYRLRQQSLIAALGMTAARGVDLDGFLAEACRVAASGMDTHLAKVLERRPDENRLLVRAGVGWKDGVVGHATIGGDLESPAGFALQTARPVISNHLTDESRFRTPQLLLDHGVNRAINVIIQDGGAPYGVLEVDSTSAGRFTDHDIAFLQSAANLIAVAVERAKDEEARQEREAALVQATRDKQLLLDELNHRVKNNLQVVTGLLSLEARRAVPDSRARFEAVIDRVTVLGRLHELLYRSSAGNELDFGVYLRDFARGAAEFFGLAARGVELSVVAEPVVLGLDRAVPLSLVVNELVTNALKHAFPNDRQGRIEIALRRSDGHVTLCVADNGIGSAVGAREGLGSRLTTALAAQVGAEVDIGREGGTRVILRFPEMPLR